MESQGRMMHHGDGERLPRPASLWSLLMAASIGKDGECLGGPGAVPSHPQIPVNPPLIPPKSPLLPPCGWSGSVPSACAPRPSPALPPRRPAGGTEPGPVLGGHSTGTGGLFFFGGGHTARAPGGSSFAMGQAMPTRGGEPSTGTSPCLQEGGGLRPQNDQNNKFPPPQLTGSWK